ncbi:MAG: hypothetical protein ACU0BS_10410 [Hasllibacter sp.]
MHEQVGLLDLYAALVREGFGQSLMAAIREEVADRPDHGEIQLRVAPADAAGVRAILDVPDALPLVLSEDPTLETGQAVFAFDDVGRQVDHRALAETAARILRERLTATPERETALHA